MGYNMTNKGKTRWYPRSTHPVRLGTYECVARIIGGLYVKEFLEWDGIGFRVDMPMSVVKWRGLTKKEYLK